MPRITTDVAVRMKTEGAAKAAADTQALGQRSSQAMQKVAKEVQGLEGSFKKLSDEQLKITKEMNEMGDKGGAAYKAMAKNLDQVQKEATQVERTLKNVRRAYQETDAAADKAAQRAKREQAQQEKQARRGSFSQGLLQGVIPEAGYLQRGPGMFRQAMGAAIGGRARAGIGGMLQTPFSGAAGLAQAFQSMPGGGLLAMPLMQSMQNAQQALQFKQQKQQMAPFLRMGMGVGGMVGESADAQRNRIAAQVDQEMASQPKISYGRAPVSGIFSGGDTGRSAIGEVWKRFKQTTGGGRADFGELERQRKRDLESGRGSLQEQTREKLIEQEITKEGRSSERRRTMQDVLRGRGAKFGYALPEVMQMMGGITQAGGGTGRELMSQRLGMVGMAAQRAYGIGPEVTGAFLQAGRRGGAVGAQGRGGSAMVDAIAGGMRMGLEGSELTNWMSQMAGDIRNWQQTGIPINPGSVNALGGAMAKMGLGGVRGGAVARGITARAQQLSTRGPQGAEELILMQELGGLQGSGVGDFEEAQLRLEEGGFSPEDVRRVAGRMMGAGGGGAGGRAVFRRAMRRMGVNIGVAETRLLEKQITGQELNPEEQAKIKQIDTQISQVAGGAPENIGAIGRKAMKGIDPALQRQATQTNQQLATGATMIGTMQNLQKSTNEMATAFTNLAAKPLTGLTQSIADLSGSVVKASEKMKSFAEGDYTGMITSSGDK